MLGAVLAVISVIVAVYAIETAVPFAAAEDRDGDTRARSSGDANAPGSETQSNSDRAGCAPRSLRLPASSQSGTAPFGTDPGEHGQPAR